MWKVDKSDKRTQEQKGYKGLTGILFWALAWPVISTVSKWQNIIWKCVQVKRKLKHSWNLSFIACIREFSSLINWKNDCKFLQKCQNIDSASVSSHLICLRFTNLVKEEKLRKDHNYPWCIVIAHSVILLSAEDEKLSLHVVTLTNFRTIFGKYSLVLIWTFQFVTCAGLFKAGLSQG